MIELSLFACPPPCTSNAYTVSLSPGRSGHERRAVRHEDIQRNKRRFQRATLRQRIEISPETIPVSMQRSTLGLVTVRYMAYRIPRNGEERRGTARNGEERRGTARNGEERRGTARNGEERGQLLWQHKKLYHYHDTSK